MSSTDHDLEAVPGPASPARGFRPAGWTAGLPALALLVLMTVLRAAPEVETGIRHDLLAGRGEAAGLARSRARLEVDGRDVAVVADFPLPFESGLRLRDEALAVANVRRFRTEVAVPTALDPFRFTATKNASGLRLTGGVPSGELRAAIVDLASKTLSEDAIDDRLRLATGAPPGFAEASAFLIRLLDGMQAGEASLSGNRLAIVGDALDRPSYESLTAALRRPPAGFDIGRVDVAPPVTEAFRWSARIDPDGLHLAGFVPSDALRSDLARAAAARFPNLAVDDRMLTARGLDRRVDFAVLTRAALDGLARVQAGEAGLDGHTLSFRGETVVRTERAALDSAVRANLPAGVTIGNVEIVVVPASPFVFSAKRVDGRVELGGYLPGEPERVLAAGLVTRRYPGERLVDRTALADGAPAGFAQAERAALETLANFAEGEVVLRDRDARLGGRVLYRQLAERLRGSAATLVPDGWTAAISVEGPAPENALDRFACADLLDEAAQRHPVQFVPGKPVLAPASGSALDFASDIVRRCGAAAIRVVHVMPGGERPQEARTLAAERAASVVAALGARAVTARLIPEGEVAEGRPERTDFVLGSP